MRKWIVALSLLAMGTALLGQVVPKGIIVEPPAPEGLQVEIWVEKPAYAVNEYVRIHFRVNQDAYVYIWDISPDGVCLIFPNTREMDNFVTAGEHTVPGPGMPDYLRVVPPTGTEYLQIVATKRRVDGIVQFFGGFAPGSTFACSRRGARPWTSSSASRTSSPRRSPRTNGRSTSPRSRSSPALRRSTGPWWWRPRPPSPSSISTTSSAAGPPRRSPSPPAGTRSASRRAVTSPGPGGSTSSPGAPARSA
ncbi:MAG: DUF4384 domain-containing protein [Caldiserica bacterium]|nr:DUF4384 domain-containing protein [Caldisericota bacterium]